MSIILLVLGICVCLTTLSYFERHLIHRHAAVLSALHPLCLLGILMPHTLPGCSAHAAAAVCVTHALEWQVYPGTVANDSLLQRLQLEAAATLFLIVRSFSQIDLCQPWA